MEKLMNAQAKVKTVFLLFPVFKYHNFFLKEELHQQNNT